LGLTPPGSGRRSRAPGPGPLHPHTSVLATDEIDRIARIAVDLAEGVDRHAQPTLIHRDLHGANLLVAADGSLAAILDWDMAESWDQAGEWFKLDWMLFKSFPEGRGPFDDRYAFHHPHLESWADRCLTVDLLETLNSIPNAVTPEFQAGARERLAALMRFLGPK
jgi:fructosamine-3-kinase